MADIAGALICNVLNVKEFFRCQAYPQYPRPILLAVFSSLQTNVQSDTVSAYAIGCEWLTRAEPPSLPDLLALSVGIHGL